MRLAKQAPKLGSNTKPVSYFTVKEAIATVTKHVALAARLPEPAVTAAMEQESDAEKLHALRRAEGDERRRAARRTSEAAAAVWTSIPLPPPPAPSPEEIEQRERRRRAAENLLHRLCLTIAEWKSANSEFANDSDFICDILNLVYCLIQDEART
jgi:hypothetical protein